MPTRSRSRRSCRCAAPDLVEGPFADSFRRHLEETESQERRVRGRLEARDASPSKVKDAAGKAGGFGMALFAKSQPDTPTKLALHAFSYEHMEAAAYELLARAGGEAGDAEAAEMALAIADEEREMAGRIAAAFDEARRWTCRTRLPRPSPITSRRPKGIWRRPSAASTTAGPSQWPCHRPGRVHTSAQILRAKS